MVMTRPRVGAVASVVALALAGCSSEQPQRREGSSSAMQTCLNALRSPVETAAATTVGEIRSLTVGPGYRPAEHAFGALRDESPAAWCWTGGDGTYVSYGATADGQFVELAAVGGGGSVPTGPPVIP